MARVLVTGAQGFTGRYLVPLLLEAGYQVHGLVRPGEPAESSKSLIVHECDLGDLEGLTRVMAAVRPERVVHLAGIAFVAHGNPREIYDANLIGSRNLLQAISDADAQPSSILLASSANVYGNQRGGMLTETTTPQPVNEYGISKLAMEMVARLFMARMPITIVRPFNYTGVGQSLDFVIPKIVDHFRRRATHVELGDIDVERDFSDVRAVCDIYSQLIEQEQAVGQTLNVCSGKAYSLRAVIKMVEQVSGHPMIVEMNPAFIRPNEVQKLYGDNSRLEEVLGPLHTPLLEDTLRWMVEA